MPMFDKMLCVPMLTTLFCKFEKKNVKKKLHKWQGMESQKDSLPLRWIQLQQHFPKINSICL